MSLNLHIGAQVRAARQRLRLTQEDVAEKAERTVEAISNIERGKSLPTLDTLSRLSAILSVPLRDFFPGETQRSRQTQRRLDMELRLRELARLLPDADLEIAVTQVEALLPRSAKARH